jgi:hypothetical protein
VAQMLFSLMFVSGLKFLSPERFGFPNFQLAMAKKVFAVKLYSFYLQKFAEIFIDLLSELSICKFHTRAGYKCCLRIALPHLAALQLLPMALGWWIYGVSGVIALKYLNVPMFR